MSPTSYQTALSRAIERRNSPCILSHIFSLYGAENRNRTDTMFNHRRILSPVRLPVPPPRHDIVFSQVAISFFISLLALRVGLEPTTYRLTAGCSTIELPKHDSDFIIACFYIFVNIFITFSIPNHFLAGWNSYLATSYSTTRLPKQYHRRYKA